MRIEYIILIGLATIIFILSLYVYFSNRKNKRISSVNFAAFSEKKYGEINLDEKHFLIYSSKNIREVKKISFDELLAVIDPINQATWQQWLEKIQTKHDFQKDVISLFVNQFFGYDRALMKLSLKRRMKEKVYVKIDLIPQTSFVKSSYVGSIDMKQFFHQMNGLSLDLSKPAGTFFCINFSMFETLINRYGHKVVNPYLTKLYELVHDFRSGHLIIGHYAKDAFLIYKHGLTSQISINSFVQKMIHHFQTSIHMEEFQFDLYPYIGVLLLGEFNKNVNQGVRNVYEITLKAIEADKQIMYYDAEMDYKNMLFEAWRYEILNVMKKKNYMVQFYPIISLLSGNRIAHVLDIDYTSQEIANFDLLYQSAKAYQLHNELFGNVLQEALNAYLARPDKSTLLLYCEMNSLEVFEQLYLSNTAYQSLNISLIFPDYSDLYLNKRATQLVDSLRSKGITFGVLANRKMQTTIYDSLRLFSFLVVPHTFIESNDERTNVTVRAILANVSVLNMQTVVFNVTNYAIAERVKGLGIDFINGPLFDDRNDDIISVRKISKLVEGSFYKR